MSTIDSRRRRRPMHCSGPSIIALLRTDMADRVITSTSGTEFTFGA